MTEWWTDRSPRERTLLAVLAGLFGVLVLSLLIFRPAVQYRETARADWDRAERVYLDVARAAASPVAGSALDVAGLRSLLTRTASANGLVVNRIATGEGTVDVALGEASAGTLMAWLTALERDHGVRVDSTNIRRSDGGQVIARVTFSGRA